MCTKYSLICFTCMTMIVGCAGNSPKHFDKKLAQLDKKGVVLATFTYENRLDQSDEIVPGAFVIRENGKGKEKEYTLSASKHFRVCDEDRNFCLIVLEVDEGNHFLSSVRGVVLGGLTMPVFEGRVEGSFQGNLDEIVYIGNIHMILRKKVSKSEANAGDSFRLGRIIDQMAIRGATIDTRISDEYERDINEFKKAFPNLKNHTVTKRVLMLK